MFDYRLTFNSPAYLALLTVLPVLWWFSYRSLAGLGWARRLVALALRSLILTLLVLALAEAQLARVSDRLTVMYLVDQSLSVPEDQSKLALDYVNAAIHKRFTTDRKDSAGLIVFGREAAMELPPWDEEQRVTQIESLVDREYTNLADAMKLAQASFRHDTAKRIVIVSDGNENVGNATEQAQALADAGISIDVIPVRSSARGEVAIEKISVPSDIRRGQPFDLRVVLNNTTPPGKDGGGVKGRIQVVRRAGDQQQNLLEPPNDRVTLAPGKHVFTVRETIDDPDFYTYEARFTPDDPADDALPQNNSATTFTHICGRGQVLLIQNHEKDDEEDTDDENEHKFKRLVDGLKAMNLEVTLRSTRPEELFSDLAQLQPFDTVILANVPREQFSDDQIQMLVRNTQNMGSGLVMLGGANSFGAGGWSNTALEEAMPVDFQIKSAKVVPVGALVLLMHASEMAQGNYWQKVIAQEAIKTLGGQDYCGVLHWTGTDAWLWGTGLKQVGPNRRMMLAMLSQMTPGDMPAFDSALNAAGKGFDKVQNQASAKHMIIISDGDPVLSGLGPVLSLRAKGVKISTVAVGTHGAAGSTTLQSIANATLGKYYAVNNANMLPKIYQTEARRVARPLVYEKKEGFRPRIHADHEMVRGLGDVLPPITGYVLTTLKDNPLVEVSLASPEPAGSGNNTILASWTYGLGKTAVFTSDAGKRWANAWTNWEGYDKLFSQIVSWSMREVSDSGKFNVATDVQDGKVNVVLTALDKDDEFMNFLNVGATVVGPDMKPLDLTVKQTAPGRYVGQFVAPSKGSYFIMLSPGVGKTPVRAGVNIPYSDEFRDRETNEGLLKNLARLTPKAGEPGQLIEIPTAVDREQQISKMLDVDTFRHDLPNATSSQDVWHMLVLVGSCLFFFDIFVRRVTVSFAWAPPLAVKIRDRILRRESQPVASATIDRLRSRKAEVADQLEQKRAAARFEPSPDAPVDTQPLHEAMNMPTAEPQAPQRAAGGQLAPDADKEAESYTSRLLKAKQKVWEERKKDEP